MKKKISVIVGRNIVHIPKNYSDAAGNKTKNKMGESWMGHKKIIKINPMHSK